MLRVVFLSGLCGFVLSVLAGGAYAGGALPLFDQRAGAWALTAYTQSDAGPFTHCTLLTRTKEGVLLIFSRDRNQASGMTVARSSWSLPAGARQPVAYQVDDGEVLEGVAMPLAGGIAVPVPRETPLFDQLALGKVLRLEFGDEIRAFDLAGISAILPSLAKCAQQFSADAIEALAVPPPPPPATADLPVATRRAAEEAARWARKITDEGAMPRVKLLTPEEMADARWGGFFRNAAAGWYSDKVVAALEVYHPRSLGLSDAADAWNQTLLKACDNDYVFTRLGRDDLVIGVDIDCAIKKQRTHRVSVTFRDRNGFYYLGAFHSIANPPRDDAELAAEDLRRAALALLAR